MYIVNNKYKFNKSHTQKIITIYTIGVVKMLVQKYI